MTVAPWWVLREMGISVEDANGAHRFEFSDVVLVDEFNNQV